MAQANSWAWFPHTEVEMCRLGKRSTYSKLSVEMPRETPEANLVKKT